MAAPTVPVKLWFPSRANKKGRADLTGTRFNRLVVMGPSDVGSGSGRKWLCKCDCGGTRATSTAKLQAGLTKSCGCLKSENGGAVSRRTKSKRRKFINDYRRVGDETHIHVVRVEDGKLIGIVRISVEDEEKARAFHWRIDVTHGYATTRDGRQPSVRLHQIILGKWADHKDRDRLNNCRSNLRPATRSDNRHNSGIQRMSGRTSEYKGVFWSEASRKWIAQLRVHGRAVLFARCDSEVEAATAFDRAVKQHCPEFGYLNFPVEEPRLAI